MLTFKRSRFNKKKGTATELDREREIRENLERQLAVELQSRSKFNKLTITEKVNIVGVGNIFSSNRNILRYILELLKRAQS